MSSGSSSSLAKGPAPSRGQRLLSTMRLLENAKRTKRTGWLDCGVEREDCESIADHMFRMAVSAWIIGGDRAMKMAMVHDLCECIAGDIVPIESRSGVSRSRKNELELHAMREICESRIRPLNPSVADEMMSLWLEFERAESKDARIVKDLDKLDMVVTADHYERMYSEKRMQNDIDDRPGGDDAWGAPGSSKSLRSKRVRSLSDMKHTDRDGPSSSAFPSQGFLHQFFDSTRGIFRSELAQKADEVLIREREQRLRVNDVPTVHVIFLFGNDVQLTSDVSDETRQWLEKHFHSAPHIRTELVNSMDLFVESLSSVSMSDSLVSSADDITHGSSKSSEMVKSEEEHCSSQITRFVICDRIIRDDRDLASVRQAMSEATHARILCAIKIDSIDDSEHTGRKFEETPLCISGFFGSLFKFRRVPGVDPKLVWPRVKSILAGYLGTD